MAKGDHVIVSIDGHKRKVPWGFGRCYREVEKDLAPPEVLRDILELVGYTADPTEIARWPVFRRIEAQVYAGNEHLSASDNPVMRHPKPEWFGALEPWKGPVRGEGVFAGPGPTVLPTELEGLLIELQRLYERLEQYVERTDYHKFTSLLEAMEDVLP